MACAQSSAVPPPRRGTGCAAAGGANPVGVPGAGRAPWVPTDGSSPVLGHSHRTVGLQPAPAVVSQRLTLRNGVRVGRGSPEPRCSHGDRTAWHERDWPLRAHAEYNSAPQQRVSQRLTLHGGVRVGRGSPEPRCSHGDRTAWNERDWALRAQRGVQLRAPAEGQPEADRPLQIPGPPAVAGIPATSPGGGLFLAPGACAHDGSQRARDRCNG